MQNVGSELASDLEVNIASKLASYTRKIQATDLTCGKAHAAGVADPGKFKRKGCGHDVVTCNYSSGRSNGVRSWGLG